MVVKIRLKKVGFKKHPSYRIVVTDVKRQRDGKFIERIGIYDPQHSKENIDLDRVNHWISCGAQPTDTVNDIILRAKKVN
jgi:small subunit ribosomal protein S16